MTSTIGETLRAQVAARASSTHAGLRRRSAHLRRRRPSIARELARGLVAIGAGRGTHVAILFPTGVEFVVAWLAVTRIGAVAVPISTFSTGDELRGLLADADIDVLVTIDGYRGHDYVDRLVHTVGVDLTRPDGFATAAVPALRHVFVAGPAAAVAAEHRLDALLAAGDAIDDQHLDEVEADVSPADRMVIVHTSGSTSAPKGVIHPHGPLIRHLATSTRSAVSTRASSCSPTRRSSGSAASATTSSARWSPARRSCARRASTAAPRSTSSSASVRSW